MARPRYAAGDATAKEQIIEVFWKLLEDEPFDRMTVRSVVLAADVNKNTFYYHFEGLDDLARQAVGELFLEDVPAVVLFSHGDLAEQVEEMLSASDANARFSRFALAARRADPVLRGVLRKGILELWLRSCNAAWDDLLPSEQTFVEFYLGGAMSLVGKVDSGDVTRRFREFYESRVGAACIEEMRAIARQVAATASTAAAGAGVPASTAVGAVTAADAPAAALRAAAATGVRPTTGA